MITLYTFGLAFGLPDPSPFVTKAEVLLKMAGLAYRIDNTGFRRAPKGKLPYIDDDGERIADSTFIRWHLENKYHIDFEKGLSAEQRAIGWAFEKMAEDNLYWALVDARWFCFDLFIEQQTKFIGLAGSSKSRLIYQAQDLEALAAWILAVIEHLQEIY